MTKRRGKKYKYNRLPGRKTTRQRWKNLRTQTHAKNTVVYKIAQSDEPELWEGTYHEYLRSKRWRRVKYGYFLWLKKEKKGLRCNTCNRQMTKHNRGWFNVHHKTYERLGCERHEDLELLCKDCHDKQHGIFE